MQSRCHFFKFFGESGVFEKHEKVLAIGAAKVSCSGKLLNYQSDNFFAEGALFAWGTVGHCLVSFPEGCSNG